MIARAKVTNYKHLYFEGDEVDVKRIRTCSNGHILMYFTTRYGTNVITFYSDLMHLQEHWDIKDKYDIEYLEHDKHCVMFGECGRGKIYEI